MPPSIRYQGCSNFRQRLITSILSGKSIRIDGIRIEDDEPGLLDCEANFIRLIEKLTDGVVIEINETGTSLKFKPGVIIGGSISHDCGSFKSVGWFLEGM